jgi:hypothetical protein
MCNDDFAGKKLSYIDTKTGELISNDVLIMTLPCSNYCYVEAVPSQKMEDFLGAIARGFTAFGGVPERCIIDNLKSGVVKPDRYEPTLTALLEQLSTYYNCPFIPARIYKPKDKASVERHVQIVYQQVYAPRRDVEYHSLKALNDGIRQQLAIFHQLSFQRNKNQNRLSLFTTVEQTVLKAFAYTALCRQVYRLVQSTAQLSCAARPRQTLLQRSLQVYRQSSRCSIYKPNSRDLLEK